MLATMLARDPSSADYGPIDLAPVGQRRAGAWTSRFDAKAMRLATRLHPTPVHGHAATLAQAVDALLSNAWRYSDAGTTVHLTIEPRRGQACIEIVDHGIGIIAADMPHVRDRFFRADRTRSRTIGGSGLGLALVNAIAAAHGGTLELISTPGEGTRAQLWLPLATDPDSRNESCETDTP